MTAGRGVVHSEMPGPVDTHGLQLWVNLRKAHKMVEPNYQEMNAEEVKSASQNGVSVKGEFNTLLPSLGHRQSLEPKQTCSATPFERGV